MKTPVNFETAKLLKEKGFDIEIDYGLNQILNLKPAPTIADVVMWLYNKHGIWIIADVLGKYSYYGEKNGKFIYVISKIKDGTIINNSWGNVDKNIKPKPLYLNSPTEAYLEAIKYTLNKLI